MRFLLREAQFAVRRFGRRSSFPGVLLALALGVGANSATLTLAAALLLAAPDHVRDPERVVLAPAIGTWVAYSDVSRRSKTLDLAARTRNELSLGAGAEAAAVRVECVTRGYFDLLGVRPVAGRTFRASDAVRGAGGSIVLSHGLWMRRFGGRPEAVGRRVVLSDRGHVVAGVMPRGFRGAGAAAVDAWIPLVAAPELCSFTGTDLLDADGGAWLRVAGRLRDGFGLRDAEAELASLAFETPPGRLVVPAYGAWRARTRDGRVTLWLAGAGGLIFLVACLNVAVLLSIQGLDRAGEFAVRMQLGATRAQVFAQFLLEHLVAAFACAAAAAGVGGAVGRLLAGLLPVAGLDEFFGGPFFLRLAALTLLAGVASGVGPAIGVARNAQSRPMQATAAPERPGGGRRGGLVAAQFALAVVLVVGAGLFVGTVRHLTRAPGFDPDRVIVATVDLARAGYSADRIRGVFEEFLRRLEKAPRAVSAAVSLAPLLGSGSSTRAFPIRAAGGAERTVVPIFNAVSPDYFATVGTRILRGRRFAAADAGGRAVVVINEGLAARLWPDAEALGRCVALGGLPCVEVVGVSEDRRHVSVTGVHHEVFVPWSQTARYVAGPTAPTLLVRSRGVAREAVGPVAAALRGADPGLPFLDVRLLADLVDGQTRSWRLGAVVFGLLGGFALALAAVGGFAVLALSVRSRTREIGIRMALGARRGNVLLAVFRGGMGVVGAGLLIGGAAAAAVYRLMDSLLVGVTPADPTSFAAAFLVVLAAGAAACLLPAFRAARMHPAEGVRQCLP